MAGFGEVAERVLDPQWTTIAGRTREWIHTGRLHAYMQSAVPTRTPGQVGVALVSVVGPAGAGGPSEESDTRSNVWVADDGRSRQERLDPGSGQVASVFVDDGVRRVEMPTSGRPRWAGDAGPNPPFWIGDPTLFLGLVRLTFEERIRHRGRPAVVAAAVRRGTAAGLMARFGPVVGGIAVGVTADVIIDEATGLALRYVARDGDGAVISIHEYTSITVGEPVDEELLACEFPLAGDRPAPGT